MKRGDLVTIALQGDYGKPWPALIMQSDFFDAHPSVTILPVSSDLRDMPLFRVTVKPNLTNALRKPSQVMVDKSMTVAREKIGDSFGRLDAGQMLEVERCLAVFLGIAK
ncbi:type II toxin-antitoxin system PemK/MazF family toxin [Propionivibrio sp.]|uniref:type II toxin-antitoxin system PemK/MazF family toxin n=1 Tax=Propionivibrio sp. TaxID=2212460 RepID=UPI0026318F45|nr:type II toxin-antitoxin system PemK/MazF family toxin [Propionivibrio sp.]